MHQKSAHKEKEIINSLDAELKQIVSTFQFTIGPIENFANTPITADFELATSVAATVNAIEEGEYQGLLSPYTTSSFGSKKFWTEKEYRTNQLYLCLGRLERLQKKTSKWCTQKSIDMFNKIFIEELKDEVLVSPQIMSMMLLKNASLIPSAAREDLHHVEKKYRLFNEEANLNMKQSKEHLHVLYDIRKQSAKKQSQMERIIKQQALIQNSNNISLESTIKNKTKHYVKRIPMLKVLEATPRTKQLQEMRNTTVKGYKDIQKNLVMLFSKILINSIPLKTLQEQDCNTYTWLKSTFKCQNKYQQITEELDFEYCPNNNDTSIPTDFEPLAVSDNTYQLSELHGITEEDMDVFLNENVLQDDNKTIITSPSDDPLCSNIVSQKKKRKAVNNFAIQKKDYVLKKKKLSLDFKEYPYRKDIEFLVAPVKTLRRRIAQYGLKMLQRLNKIPDILIQIKVMLMLQDRLDVLKVNERHRQNIRRKKLQTQAFQPELKSESNDMYPKHKRSQIHVDECLKPIEIKFSDGCISKSSSEFTGITTVLPIYPLNSDKSIGDNKLMLTYKECSVYIGRDPGDETHEIWKKCQIIVLTETRRTHETQRNILIGTPLKYRNSQDPKIWSELDTKIHEILDISWFLNCLGWINVCKYKLLRDTIDDDDCLLLECNRNEKQNQMLIKSNHAKTLVPEHWKKICKLKQKLSYEQNMEQDLTYYKQLQTQWSQLSNERKTYTHKEYNQKKDCWKKRISREKDNEVLKIKMKSFFAELKKIRKSLKIKKLIINTSINNNNDNDNNNNNNINNNPTNNNNNNNTDNTNNTNNNNNTNFNYNSGTPNTNSNGSGSNNANSASKK